MGNLRNNLPPFDRRDVNPYEKTRTNSVGVNTLDYKRNLCYEYDTLTFDGMTPEQFQNTVDIRNRPTAASADGVPFTRTSGAGEGRYFVGVILPKKGPSSIIEFDVCSSEGRCQKGGSVATFGTNSGTSSVTRNSISSTNYYISEVEVTNLNVENWNESFAVVVTSPNVSPVSPIIIWRPQGTSLDGGKVILAPGINRGMYGDLLDSFTVKK